MRALVLLSLLLFLPVTASAQAADVNNPTGLSFTPSTDHATIASYELDIFRADNTLVQTINIGKPTPDATNVCFAQLNVQPITFGLGYNVRLRAVVTPTVVSDWAVGINKFNRIPGKPGGPTLK